MKPLERRMHESEELHKLTVPAVHESLPQDRPDGPAMPAFNACTIKVEESVLLTHTTVILRTQTPYARQPCPVTPVTRRHTDTAAAAAVSYVFSVAARHITTR